MGLSVNTRILVSLFLLNLQYLCALSRPQVPCFFIFGDSLVDNGNNNQLKTTAKANYMPSGIDFPGGPTGRFTNGRNQADFIAELLGFNSHIPPFAMAQGRDILSGVNYGSGSAGIRNETGEQLGVRISIDRQLENHKLTISRINNLLGNKTSAKQLLNKCVYLFVVGSNDYRNNYYIPDYYSSSKIYTTDAYAKALVDQFSQQLKMLYNLGAKRFALSGINALGCIPQEVSKKGSGSACFDAMNDAVHIYNDKLKVLVDDLNNNLTDAKFVFIDPMNIVTQNLLAVGVKILTQPCCKVSNITGMCISGQAPCPVRTSHAFYDNFHPTELVAKLIATNYIISSNKEVDWIKFITYFVVHSILIIESIPHCFV